MVDIDQNRTVERLKRQAGWLTLLVGVQAILICYIALIESRKSSPFFTWDDFESMIELPVVDSPYLQLAGHVTLTRRYGVMHRGKVSSSAYPGTIIYEDRQYFLVVSSPTTYVRSLLDKKEYPLLAMPKLDRQPIDATTIKDATEKAKIILRQFADECEVRF